MHKSWIKYILILGLIGLFCASCSSTPKNTYCQLVDDQPQKQENSKQGLKSEAEPEFK